MTKKKKEYIVPSRKQPVFKFVAAILRLFFKKPEIVYLDGMPPEKAIVVSNHSAKKGPMALELYYPRFNVMWGAHQMFGNYSSRWHYLRDVLYVQKCGKNKFTSSIKSTFEAIFSPYIYKGMKLLPTYQDSRLKKTVNNSIKVLESNANVMVFPENSNNGYKEIMTEFFPGFVVLAEQYYKKTGVDLPVYPMYYHLKYRKMVIGKPIYVQELVAQGMNRNQIAKHFLDVVNGLFLEHIDPNRTNK